MADATATAPEAPTTTSDTPNAIAAPAPPPDTSQLPAGRTAPAPQYSAPTPPPPAKHGLAAILAAVGDALGGGATRGQVDPQTGAIQQVNRSTGSKVGSAITTLIRGAAAGAGQHGPGSVGRSAEAGAQSQDQFQQQQQKQLQEQSQNVRETQENSRQQQLAQASLAMHNQQMAKMSMDRQQQGLQFSKDQAEVANQMQAIKSIPGATLLGHFKSNEDMNDYLSKISPEQSGQHAKDFANNLIQAVPNSQGGFDAYQVPKGWQDKPIGEGKTISTFTTEIDKDGKVKPVWKSMPAPPDMTTGAYMTWQGQTLKASTDQESHEADMAKKGAETKDALAGVNEKNASAAEKNVDTKLKKQQLQEMGDQSLSGQDYLNSLKGPYRSLVEEMGSGKMPMQRMEYLIARKPEVAAAVAKAFPDFDGSKVISYVNTFKDYTSGKTSTQLNAGGTALQHLKELHDLNTSASHIPYTPARTAYMNKVDTVASELAKFYGDTTIPAIASIKATLASEAPGSRNIAIRTQAKSMGDKLDSYEQQWKNAAPSKAYQAPMPGISEKAKLARAALDPDYAQGLTHPSMQNQPLPQGATHIVPGPDGHNHYTNEAGTVDYGVAP